MNILVCGQVHGHMLYVHVSAYSVDQSVGVEGLWQRYECVSICVIV